MGSFTFLAPQGLWLLGLIAPVVLLYILKVRRRRSTVSSTWLWEAYARDLLARSPFRKLVAQTSLLLQIAIVVLLALALSRPAALGAQKPGGHVAIIVDTSASMSARAGERGTRLDLAKKAARDVAESLPPGSLAMVIEAGREPRIASALERDPRRVAAAVDALAPLEVEGDLSQAVAMAIDKMKGLGDSKVVVVTDGYLARPLDLQAPAVPVEVVRVGDATDNHAIVRADVRIGIDPESGQEQAQGFLLAANYGSSRAELYVTMRRPDAPEPLDSRRLLVEPGEKAPVVLSFEISSADYETPLLFELSPHDEMPVDDAAYAVVPRGDRLPVVLVSASAETSPWIERALKSDKNVDPKRVSLEDLGAADIDPSALVVVEGACPPADTRGGDLLVVAPPKGGCFGVDVRDPVDAPLLTSWAASDSRLKFLTLDGVTFAKATVLVPPSPTMALVRAREGVIACDASTTSRTVTLLGFDPGETDWPLKASFVLFIRNVTELARSHRLRGHDGGQRTGDPLTLVLSPNATDVVVTSPDEKKLEASLRSGSVIVPSVVKAGFYRVRYEIAGERVTETVAVNLASAAESDLSKPTEIPASAGIVVHEEGDAPRRYRSLGWIVALVALAVLLVEVFLYSRKPRSKKAAA